MTDEQTTDPVERARALLGLEEVDANIEMLLQGLLDRRQGCHPDRFTDPEAQANATKQFQEIQELISQLESILQRSIVKREETNLAETKVTETLSYRLQLNAKEQEIENLKDEIKKLRMKCQSIESELIAERDSRRDKEFARIRELYKPSKGHIIGSTLTVLLASTIAILSQIEQIGASLERLIPTSSGINRLVLFWIAIVVIAITLLKFLKNFVFKAMMGKVCTTSFANKFFNYVSPSRYPWDDEKPQKPVHFSEEHIIKFLSAEFKLIPYSRRSRDNRLKGLLSHAKASYQRILSFLKNWNSGDISWNSGDNSGDTNSGDILLNY